MEMVCFRLPGHGDTTLKHMNSLRCHQHFCDITIMANNNQTFKGHKVVLAACSPYLRDQFLLNPSPKLQVSMLYSASVVCDLLQSCYTGFLQFSSEEIVNYLTAASYFQMEHIVELCRGALEKYVQLKNLGSQKSAPQQSAEGNDASKAGQEVTPHHEDSLDNACIKVITSDEEGEARQQDYNVYRVYVPDDNGNNREVEYEKGASADAQRDVYSEKDAIVIGESGAGEFELNLAEDLTLSEETLRAFRRRLSDSKLGRGRGRGRGRGFKRRRWMSSQEKRPSSLMEHQDLWYLTGMGGYGVDFSQEGLKTSGNYVSVEIPRMDLSISDVHGDQVSPLPANSASQFPLGESSPGEGSSGLTAVGSNEGSDDSVAVVGSTSSVTGPVICEHCGLTFPSAHALALHSRSTHLLYSCPCCGKHFHHSSNLTRHMAVHRGAGKTHQCPLCYKTFTQKSTLIDHMNLHSGERPHRCAYCHARFAHKPALRRHLKEQHGKTTGQNSLHEQEERERAMEAAGGRQESAQEDDQECVVSEQVS